MILEMFSKLLADLLKRFRRELTPILRDLEIRDPQTYELVAPELTELVRAYRVQAAEIANRFMREAAAELDGEAFLPPVEGYPDQAVQKVLQNSRSLNDVTASLERHVRTAARRQVVRAVPAPVVPSASAANPDADQVAENDEGLLEDIDEEIEEKYDYEYDPDDDDQDEGPDEEDEEEDEASKRKIYPVAWARVLSGSDNCAFCVMLASRGPVYSSAHHGGGKSKKNWQGESRSRSNSYHNNCDCLVVPVYDANRWEGKEQADALYKIYEQVTKNQVAGGKSVGQGNDKLKDWSDYLKKLKDEGKEIYIPGFESSEKSADTPDAVEKKSPAPAHTKFKSVLP